ncbi:MAG: DNA polymerase III subunit gamma/tau [Chthoniobacteraceae bacterium]
MSYQVFARKYRPQNFDTVIGQEHVTRTLKNAIEQNRLAQAYLFVGPRGTGKTSTARILAKALNCIHGPTVNPCGVCDSCKEIAAGNSMNVLEFDAASNTQVDKIREIIIETVKYAPTSGRYKMYIVDEVHMLSNSSFNALLKTLEEPPSHVKFIFATTDVEKVPTTIVSRCQRFDLRRIPTHRIAEHLLHIAQEENVALSDAAAEAIAKGAEGGMRDAESMLDQLVAFCGEKIEEQDVLAIFGFTSAQVVADLCGHLLAGDPPPALALVHAQAESGKDLSKLMGDLIGHLRNLLVIKVDPQALDDELSAEEIAVLNGQTEQIPLDRLLELVEQFAAADSRMKWAPNKKLHFEIAVIKAIQSLSQATLTDVIDTLSAIRGGAPLPERPAKPAAAPVARPVAERPKLNIQKPAPAPAPVQPPTPAASTPAAAPVAATPEPRPAPEPPPKATEGPREIPVPVQSAAGLLDGIKAQIASINQPPKPTEPAPKVEPPLIVEEPTPVVEETSTGLPDPRHVWKELILGVRKGRPLITSWLESGALVSLDAKAAVLAFPPSEKMAYDSLLRPANQGFIEDLLKQITGLPLPLKCELREGLVVERLHIEEPPPPKPVDPAEDFKNDPLIQKALELFKAEIQPA